MESLASELLKFKTDLQNEVINVYSKDKTTAVAAFKRWEMRYKDFLSHLDQKEIPLYDKIMTSVNVLMIENGNYSYDEFMERIGKKVMSSIETLIDDIVKERKKLTTLPTSKQAIPTPTVITSDKAKPEKINFSQKLNQNLYKYINEEPEMSTIFIDITGFSRRVHSERMAMTEKLNNIIKSSISDKEFSNEEGIIFIPTGDGMAIAIKTNKAELSFDLAVQIRKEAIAKDLPIRVGLNKAQDTIVKDINSNINLCGSGIIGAQRIMDFGNANELLISEAVYLSIADRKGKERFKKSQKKDKHDFEWTFYYYQ